LAELLSDVLPPALFVLGIRFPGLVAGGRIMLAKASRRSSSFRCAARLARSSQAGSPSSRDGWSRAFSRLLPTEEDAVKVLLSLLVLVALVPASAPAFAYVGPGAGLSLVGAFWGLLVAIFAALAFVVLWPIRRFLKQRRGSPTAAPQQQTAEQASLAHADRRNA
jgi:hypothetical protein